MRACLGQDHSKRLRLHPPVQPAASGAKCSPNRATPQQPLDGIAETSDVARYLAWRDLILYNSDPTNFIDCPVNYWVWKSSFLNAIDRLNLSASEELDLLIKWLWSVRRKNNKSSTCGSFPSWTKRSL